MTGNADNTHDRSNKGKHARPGTTRTALTSARSALPALPRPAELAGPALLAIGALSLSLLAVVPTSTTVTITADGVSHTVDVDGSTVAEALEAADIHTSSRDLISPAGDTDIRDGDIIIVRHARPLTLVVDGHDRTVWITSTNVDDALDEVGLHQRRLALSASRSRRIPRDGLTLKVRTPKTITINADGSTRPATTTAATVGDALAQADITLSGTDTVQPDANTELTDDLTITVTRIASHTDSVDRAIDYSTQRRNDSNLAKGRTRQIKAGQDGLLRITYRITRTDGQITARQEISREQVRAPQTRIIAVGTKATPTATSTDRDGLNWAALARCESGGNPRAVSPTGAYRGLYQFSLSTWRSVGGTGDPIAHTSAEQTRRAKILYSRSGRSPWPHCGKYL